MAQAPGLERSKACIGLPAKFVTKRAPAHQVTLPSKLLLPPNPRSKPHAQAGRNRIRLQTSAAVSTFDAPSASATEARSASAAAEQTPKALGFTMPGEFEPHANCWMAWPDSSYLWRENAKPAQQQYANIAKAISKFEPVVMMANPESADEARAAFEDAPNVSVVEMHINDAWARDWGPTCLVKEDKTTGKRVVAGTHWDFDSYGATIKRQLGIPTQVPDWSDDNAAGRHILEHHDLEVFESTLRMEGGSIHTDGQGTLICTEQCLLHPSRNPALDKEGIETQLKEFLGIDKIIWLWRGMAGDDVITNGHVDSLACFVRPGEVLLSWTDDVHDPQHEISQDAYDILTSTPDAKGRRIKVTKVPTPYPVFRTYGEADGVHPEHIEKGYSPQIPEERLPASYINHYVANGAVIVPCFGGASADRDAEAVRVIKKAYGSAREVVSVNSREVLLNGGSIHSITQQNPAVTSDPPKKAAPNKPASGGFFDSAVGSDFRTRSASPPKAAPKRPTSSKPASGGFFDSAVGSDFKTRSVSPPKAAPKRPTSNKPASSGFFDSAVGSDFKTRSVSPPKAAPRQRTSSKPASGGFFDSAVGSDFKTRSVSPPKAAPRQPASNKPASGGFFDSAVGSEFGKRSVTPPKAAPRQAAPKQPASTSGAASGSSKGFFDSAVGSEFGKRSVTPPKAAPRQPSSNKPASGGFFDSAVGSDFKTRSVSPPKAAPRQPASNKPASGGFFDSAVGSEFKTRSGSPPKAAPKQPPSSKPASRGFF